MKESNAASKQLAKKLGGNVPGHAILLFLSHRDDDNAFSPFRFFPGNKNRNRLCLLFCCPLVYWLCQEQEKIKLALAGNKIQRRVCSAGLGGTYVVFLGAVVVGSTILNPGLFPFLAAGGNFLVFAVLQTLKVIWPTQKDFLLYCGEHNPDGVPILSPEPEQKLPKWKRMITAIFAIYFLVWVISVSFFWAFASDIRSGNEKPTATQTESLTDHGYTVYIRPDQKRRVKLLERCFAIGIPSVFVIGGLLHFVLGVKVFSNPSQKMESVDNQKT